MAYKFPCCEQCYFHRKDPAVCEECEDASEFEPAEEDRLERTRASTPARRLMVDGRSRGTIEALGQYHYTAILKRNDE